VVTPRGTWRDFGGCGAVNIHFPTRSVAQCKNREGKNEEERGRAEDTIVKRIVKLREHTPRLSRFGNAPAGLPPRGIRSGKR